jgi:hypothetical protein
LADVAEDALEAAVLFFAGGAHAAAPVRRMTASDVAPVRRAMGFFTSDLRFG